MPEAGGLGSAFGLWRQRPPQTLPSEVPAQRAQGLPVQSAPRHARGALHAFCVATCRTVRRLLTSAQIPLAMRSSMPRCDIPNIDARLFLVRWLR